MRESETVRIVTLEGKVSDTIWTIIRTPDRNNLVIVEDSTGSRLTIHKRRVLPKDTEGKAVAMGKAGTQKAVCPKCTRTLPVECARVDCPTHGTFGTVNYQGAEAVNMVRRSKSNKPDRRQDQMSATETPQPVEAPKTQVVDIEEVKKFGDELWVKTQLNFDHVTMDVRAYALLADDPVRKLCFNTYDGTLGKKKAVEDLQLADFKANQPPPGKKPWHTPKGTIEEARTALQKKGYTQA